MGTTPRSINATRVVVVEPNPFYRHGLVQTIEDHPALEVVGETADPEAAAGLLRDLRPDVVLVDAVTGMDLLETAAPVPPAVVLSGSAATELAYRALAAGARAYLSKDETDVRGLCETIVAVTRGQMVISSEVQATLARDLRTRRGTPDLQLTPREREVLALAAQGLTAAATAERLGLSLATVKTHLHHLYEKLGVGTRAGAVAEGMRRGLVD